MALGCQVRPQWSVASTLLLISFTGFLAPALGQVLPSLTGNPCSTVGVLFADDFSSTATSSQRWATNTGTVGTACGSLGDGNSAWFAGSEATRELISKPLDLTKADTMAIQFGRGTCSSYSGISTYTVRVQYAVGDQGSYITIYSFLASATVSRDVSFAIPTAAQASNVKIRIYQASFTRGGTAWGVDNIFIGYSTTHGFFDSFTSLFTNCNWFFPTGGVARPACGSTGSVLDMGNSTITPGARVLSSRMFQTSCSDPACGRTMMFDLRMLCNGIASATPDELSTVLTLTVYGAGSRKLSSQTYKAGSYATWRRVAFMLPSATATRVVLEQTAGSLSTTHWAVDNFYLGSGCTTFCNGRGFCTTTGTCQCDAGYTGSDCSTVTGPLPSLLADNFDAPLTSNKNWVVYAGVTAGTACTTITDGKAAQFNIGSNRVLETRDLHLTVYSVISYYFLYPPSPCRRPTSSSYQVTLQYSVTAGLSWVAMRTMSYTSNYNSPVQYRLAIPTAAVGKPVRFRWLQNLARGDNQDVALIDNVFIGAPVNASQAPIVDNLDNVAEGSGTIVATSVHGSNVSYCNSLGGTMFFNPTSTSAYSAPAQLLLQPILLPAGVNNVVQFDLYMGGCSATTITTAYSYITLGVAVSATSSFNRVKTFAVQDYSNYWHRVAGTLNYATYGGRSVWISIFQTENEALSTGLSWAVDNLYIGKPCPNLCSGRGYCQRDVTCKCDTGFSGSDCSNTTTAYPTYLKESFSGSKVGPLLQNPVAMALTTSYCGLSISSGGYLSGYAKSYVRKLETGPLDLSSVLPLIQYRFQNGYGSYSNLASTCRYPTSPSYQVYFQYSTDNGLNWVTLTTLSYGSYRYGQDVTLLLKQVARTKAVRLRWYQGSLSTPIQLSVSYQVWSVDNIAIGSTVTQSTNGTGFIDNFNSFTGKGWSSLASAVASTYCSSTSPVLLFQTSTTQGTQRYATTDIFTLLLDPKKSPTENFNTIPAGWQVVGGQLSQTCGMTSSGVVFAAPGTRSLTSAPYDTSSANTLRFFITQGNSNCDGPDDTNENVNLLYSVNGAAFVQLQTFPFNAAQVLTPRTVFVQLPAAAIAKSVRFQWVQPKNSGGGFDQWGIDTFVAQQLLSPVQYFVQFDLLTSCTTAAISSTSYPIVLQVANRTMASAGTTATGSWVPARSTCTRATSGTGCVSNMYTQGSTYLQSTYTGWRRITVPIDANLALSKLVQFRWIQDKFASFSPAWAIDNVYIGWKCPNMCMGHGRCVGGTCQCDAGFGGSDCSPTGQFPFEVKDNFAAGFNPAKWLLWTGNTTVSGGRCGPLQGSSSLLFSEAGEREAITVDMDTTQAKSLEFVLRMGAYVGSTCDRPDNYGETVVVQYSDNGGIDWVNLWTTTCTTCWNTEPTESIVVALPTGAKTGATRFRWWQPSNGGTGQDEWRIGNVFIGGQSPNNVRLFDSFDPGVSDGNWVFHPNGVLEKGHCYNNQSEGNALVFSQTNGARLLYTRDLNITAGTIVQFDFVHNCAQQFGGDTYDVRLQYSKNFGSSWTDMGPACTSSGSTSCVTGTVQSTYLREGAYNFWKRATFPVPTAAQSVQTRFRWFQAITTGHPWAIDNVFIGTGCINGCSGRGACRPLVRPNATVGDYCHCDTGFTGSDCSIPHVPLSSNFTEDFGNDPLVSKWTRVVGYTLSKNCGTLSSGNALYFHKGGLRMAETVDFNTTDVLKMSFYIVIGSSSTSSTTCRRSSYTGNSVLLQYSTTGGLYWSTLQTIPISYYTPRQISPNLPSLARTTHTRFRWIQPYNQGNNLNQWAIDSISFAQAVILRGLSADFTSSSQSQLFATIASGSILSAGYCSQKPALVMNQGTATRTLKTASLDLSGSSSGNTAIQFWLNIGCGKSYGTSLGTRVVLSYSTGTSTSRVTLQPQCNIDIGSPCTTTSQKGPGSQFYWQAYSKWRRVTYMLPSNLLVAAISFTWTAPNPTNFAIRDLYIGTCTAGCNGHGNCKAGSCQCDSGWSGTTCATRTSPLPFSVSDNFNSYSSVNWPVLVGGTAGTTCTPLAGGNALTFSGTTLRYVISQAYDLRHATTVAFYIRVGSSSGACETADSRNEGVLFSYTLNDGITWTAWQTYDHISYRNARRVSYSLTTAMKVQGVRFRFWQPTNSGTCCDYWAVDSFVITSPPPPLPTVVNLADNFTSSAVSATYWASYQGRYSTTAAYCSRTQLWTFSGTSVATNLTSAPVDLRASSGPYPAVIQFMINTGCGATQRYPVYLYRRTVKSSFTLVRGLCVGTSCSDGGHLSTAYQYQTSSSAFQWVTINLANLGLNLDSVSFSWYQSVLSTNPRWAIDNVYIGTTCPSACYGHGRCTTSGVCECWAGYSGTACQVAPKLPNNIQEGFTSGTGTYFSNSIGSGVGTNCGTLFSGNALVFVKTGLRQAITNDFDTSKASTLSFYFIIGGPCQDANSPNEGIVLQYSNNGGVDWSLLSQLGYTSRTASLRTVTLPSAAKTTSTRFRWWQGSNSGAGNDGWAIDQVTLTTPIFYPTLFYDDFSNATATKSQLTFSSASYRIVGTPTPCAASTSYYGNTLSYSNLGNQYFTTGDLNMAASGSVLQFQLVVGCETIIRGAQITLQYSTDQGATFKTVVPGCKIGDTSCVGGATNYQWSSVYRSSTWQRVTVPLPTAASVSRVRFRWQQGGGTFNWTVDSIYIGSNCSGCTNRGSCMPNGACLCDPQFGGSDCSINNNVNPKGFLETFENLTATGVYWESASGYIFGAACGTLFSGNSAVFNQDNTGLRYATSRDYDTRHATILTFFFRIGGSGTCDNAEVDEDVAIQVSLDAGFTWSNWNVLQYNQFPYVALSPGQVQLPLPEQYRTNSTRFRFWQTKFTGADYDVWAVDNIYLGPSTSPLPNVLTQQFDTSSATTLLWYPGGRLSNTCPGTQGQALTFAQSSTASFHFFETLPMTLSANSVIMLTLSINCQTSVPSTAGTAIYPIEVTMATNGSAYQLIQGQNCLTKSSVCPLGSGLPTSYYGYDNAFSTYQRIAIPVTSRQDNTRIRVGAVFLAGMAIPSFAVDYFYAGPACPRHCSGHGVCASGKCNCDAGYTSTDCSLGISGGVTSIQETFESGVIDPKSWALVQGGSIVTANAGATASCGVVAAGNSLYFNGAAFRQLVTVDMDTTGSLYLQFNIRIGSLTGSTGCAASSLAAARVTAQYSVDGGATWTDMVSIPGGASANFYNLSLPAQARTSSIRFRIYQPLLQAAFVNQWAIDNVMIVGNTSALLKISETFDPLKALQWSTLSAGQVGSFCGSQGRALIYRQNSTDTTFVSNRATTVAVRPDVPVTVQFSLAFDCTFSSQTAAYSLFQHQGTTSYVNLQYSNDGGVTWKWVHAICKPVSSPLGVPQCAGTAVYEPTSWYFTPGSGWKRIVVQIFDSQINSLTQFRWQSGADRTLPINNIKRFDFSYALDNILISRSCPNACRGHGTCTSGGTCQCDSGFNGTDCMPATPLAMVLRDNFETTSSIWLQQQGAQVVSFGCATSATPTLTGKRLHFGYTGRRRATTVDMDTQFATQITFGFLPTTGNCPLKSSFSYVFVMYSTDGGYTFYNLYRLNNTVIPRSASPDQNISIPIPPAARGKAVRFRWWQPDHDDVDDAFEIDNINIGGICNTIPCQNGATCVEQSATAFKCQCPPEYKGTLCDVPRDPCLATPCLNNAQCIPNLNTSTYVCNCTTDYTGRLCQYYKNGCTLSPCKNGATCFDYTQLPTFPTSSCFGRCNQPTVGRLCRCDPNCKALGTCCTNYTAVCEQPAMTNQFSCQCPAGYTGTQCEQIIDACTTAPCKFGVCVASLNTYTCTCMAGYTGKNCDVEINECLSSPCQNGGTCVDGLNQFSCRCAKGWSGTLCQTNTDNCQGSPCANSGTCVDGLGFFTCQCLAGFTGSTCANDINECNATANPCNSGSTCVNTVGSFRCLCQPSYTGQLCQTYMNLCITLRGPYCSNGGTCSQNLNQVSCNCSGTGYYGTQCQFKTDYCSPNPCQAGGSCTSQPAGYVCACPVYRTGVQCQTDLNECISVPCANNGTCRDGLNRYDCDCVAGYTGPNCLVQLNVCAGKPCANGGTCTFFNSTAFVCLCPPLYAGDSCTLAADQCSPSPCQNGGTCSRGIGGFGHTCTCSDGYTGSACSNQIDYCPKGKSVCLNGGVCTNTLGGPSCKCATGFSGRLCELNDNDCRIFSCFNGGRCLFSNVTGNYSCNCTTAYTGEFCQTTKNFCQPSPCVNNGTCLGLVGGFRCLCTAQYNGLNCQSRLNPCLASQCFGASNCSWDGVSTGYTCQCPPDYTGTLCQARIDDCKFNSCFNAGTCVDGINSYTCTCATGFTGSRCLTNIDDCATNTCRNNATCADGVDAYTCVCPPGFTGNRCQTNVNNCANVTCQNGGTCVDGVASFRCACTSSYTGPLCESIIHKCSATSCKNGATCVNGQSTFTCNCAVGYTGAACQTNVDDCAPTGLCQNGATCVDGIASYTCSCAAGFTGQQCQTNIDDCPSNNCTNGATCMDGVNGYSCFCPTGFTGRSCGVNINDCLAAPCMNAGVCIDAINSYTCQCSAGFTGRVCQTNIDECATALCANGATCVDGVAVYTCACAAGYTGAMCQTNINDCATATCQNGGSCVDGINSYTCNCVTGFTGAMCQTNTNNCATATCQNGGSCVDGIGSYTCNCVTGFTGSMCQTNINDCANVTCANGGSCADGVNSYTCTCVAGFTGTTCQINVDDCATSKCQNGASCVDGISSYTCQCVTGFTGQLCQTNINDCTTNNCQNGATCMDAINSYTCSCAAGFTGQLCQTNINDCAGVTCGNGGSCVDAINSYTCNCQAGFTGLLCQTNINDCASNNCQNGATCVDSINSYTCSCVTGFTGSMCQTNINDCATNNCQNGATCVDGINSYICSCVTGFTGSMCQTNIDNCAGVVCRNNGTCIDGLNTHRCQCVAGFRGPVCENPSSTCTASSCRNGGTCVPATGSQAYTCTCVSGFTGPACQTNVDDCLPESCSGRGTCLDGLNSFTCMCLTGYTGANCQTNIDDCDSNQCTNGAACVDGINSYTCTCHPGSTGQFCQTNINECSSNPCKNSGACIDDINSYKCSCGTGFTGTRCETNIDDCAGVNCMNGGSCMDLVNGKTCQCAAGYTGVNCETNINDCAGVTCQNAGTCIDSVNSYSCQCVAGFTGQNCQTNPDDCTLASCTNGGTCVDGVASFTCQCPAGFTGVNCQTNADDCAAGPCANGGSCVDGVNSYTCTCRPGFTDAKCQTNIDDCVNTPCRNGASCVDGVNSFSCVCSPGFTGTACQTNVNECATANCQNGASCVDGVNAYSCQCVAGFTGAMCQTNINNCLTGACMNGGTCVDGVAAYSCQCASGFTGTRCETNINDCAGVTCGNGGACVDGRNSYTCSCQAGFTGKLCQTDIVECAAVTCGNGGSCVDGINSYTCTCQTGFTGPLCQTDIEECATSNCQNGATCVDGLGFYTCSCAAGYTGQWCQTMINNCRPNSCANGGRCVNRVGGFTCNCAPGYTGTNCGTAIDHCLQHHCQNFARCVNGLTAYTCACVTGFTGQFCQTNVDNCAQSPCNNGGTCRDGIASFTCTCPTGYTGRTCATKVTPCTEEPCQNGGTCVVNGAGYTCQCPGLFSGTNCQKASASSCVGVNCGEYGKCETGQCVCSAGWTGARCDVTVESCLTLRCANGATCAETVQGTVCSCGPGWTGRRCVVATCANQICNGKGTCQLTEGNLTTRCTCDEGYSGSSCQKYDSNTGSSTGSSSSNTIWPIIVGVVGGLLVIVVVVVAVFLYVRRGKKVYIVGTDGPTQVQYANPLYDTQQQGENLEEALGRTKRVSTLSRTPMLNEPGEDAYEEMVEGNYETLADNDGPIAAANPYMIN